MIWRALKISFFIHAAVAVAAVALTTDWRNRNVVGSADFSRLRLIPAYSAKLHKLGASVPQTARRAGKRQANAERAASEYGVYPSSAPVEIPEPDSVQLLAEAENADVAERQAAGARYVKEQFAYIRDLITSRLAYPPMARKMGWKGQVTVRFAVEEDGSVSGIKILSGSGYGMLDNNAVETIRRGSPYPRPPVRAEFVMPIAYRLD